MRSSKHSRLPRPILADKSSGGVVSPAATQLNTDYMATEQRSTIKSTLREKYDQLSRCLVVSNGLLFNLKTVDYMRQKVPKLSQHTTANQKATELLNILDDVPDSQQQSVFNTFLSALRRDGQEHVANIFIPKSDARPMTDIHYHLFADKIDELGQFINPTYSLMNRLVHEGVLNQCDKEIVMSRSNYTEMSLELVNILQRKPDSAFDTFTDALKVTEQHHVVYILTGKGDERPLSRLRRRVLIKAREILVRKIEIVHSTLIDKLISNGVLNEVDMLQIEAKQTSEEKTRVLLDAIARKSQSAYDFFIQAFKHSDINQLDIARLLEGLELSGRLEANFKGDVKDTEKSRVFKMIRQEIDDFIKGNGSYYDVDELTLLMEQNGFAISEIREGSILISFRCFTEESLDNLKRSYHDKTLDKLFNRVFSSRFANHGLESLELRVADDVFHKLTETFRQTEAQSQLDKATRQVSELDLIADQRSRQLQTSVTLTCLPVELLELLLMRSFIHLFTDHYKSHYKPHEAVRLGCCTLAAVCNNWWQTMNGWPQSTTKHWFKHKLRHAVKYVCGPYVLFPRLQSSLSMPHRVIVGGVTVCDNKRFVLCSNVIRVFGPNNEQLTDIELEQLISPRDIVSCTETRQLYLADWALSSLCVWRVSLDGREVVKWLPNKPTNRSPFSNHTLSIASRRLLVTTQHEGLFLYGADGVELKHVRIPGLAPVVHAVETSRDTFIVSISDRQQSRVCEVNAYGHMTRLYCDQQQLSNPVYLSLDSDGRIFVADHKKHRVILLNSETLDLERVLLDTAETMLTPGPLRLCYIQQSHQLALTGWSGESGCFQLFSLR